MNCIHSRIQFRYVMFTATSAKLFVAYVGFLLCLLTAGMYAYRHPAYNWDMLAYMALIVKLEGSHTMDEIHAVTYQKAKSELSVDIYENLTSAVPLRKQRAENAAAFYDILPMYAAKPLYCWLA